ncbi:MAG: hypothetical protein R2715_14270 [Ilumatobacteraceae bacterium]
MRLFAAVAGFVEASRVLYPGSFVDVTASFVFPAVTYVDVDRRTAKFFADREGHRDHRGQPDHCREPVGGGFIAGD